MKPSDHKVPIARTEGKTVIHDHICHFTKSINPTCRFEFPAWDHPDIFGNHNPIKIEFCSGNGQWIAQRAASDPTTNWVAVEMKLERTRKIWCKIKNLKLDNLFIINGEGEFASRNYLPKNSVQEIFINFPDPWPKRHHARHRLVKPSFVQAIAELLTDQGSVTIVTDDLSYSEWTLKIFKNSPDFICNLPFPHRTTEWPGYGDSYFDSLWREKGRTILYHHFHKRIAP